MDDIDVVRRTVKDYDKHYKQIYNEVFSLCQGVKTLFGDSIISKVYGRPGSDDNKPEYKEDFKILEKLLKNGREISTENIISLTDIIGLTVVFYYGDDMDGVIARITQDAKSRNYVVSEPEKHLNKNGYYATHIVVSKAVQVGITLKCEIQFKTMLHNAWAAKMHDLTYKPSGFVDPKTAALMSSIAGTIENLEVQSQLIRDMIKANWDVEASTRREARHQLFHLMLQYRTEVWQQEVPDEVVALSERIEEHAALIASDTNAPAVIELMGDIKSLCKEDGKIRTCWILAGRLASLRNSNDAALWFVTDAERWLTVAARLLASGELKENEHSEVSAVPIMFYVIGDMDKAIEMSETILAKPDFEPLSAFTKLSMKASLISFKLEKEYHSPTKDDKTRRQLRDKLSDQLAELVSNETVIADRDVLSSIMDTIGFHKIAFAETQEEASQGIRECMEAASIATEKERAITDAYSNLNVKLGWRRYFDLERRATDQVDRGT